MSTELFQFESDESAETAPGAQTEAPAEGTWEAYLPRLRDRYPGTRDGTLFCVHKLEEDPDLTLKDFRDEAALRGISLSGRSVHAAKVLLGMEAPVKRRRVTPAETEVEETEAPSSARQRKTRSVGASVDVEDLGSELESVLRLAVEEAARAETERLRHAIRQAIELLQDALDD